MSMSDVALRTVLEDCIVRLMGVFAKFNEWNDALLDSSTKIVQKISL
jgi:hypothetical protein